MGPGSLSLPWGNLGTGPNFLLFPFYELLVEMLIAERRAPTRKGGDSILPQFGDVVRNRMTPAGPAGPAGKRLISCREACGMAGPAHQ